MILSSLFQDGAVLQRGKDIPVWGKTLPSSLVKAELNGECAWTVSSTEGEFILYLPPFEAGGAYELSVYVPDSDEKVIVRDVLIGEVWLASGQSNMEYALGTDLRTKVVDDSEAPGRKQEKQFNEMVLDPSKFRFFTVEKKASGAIEKSCRGRWEKMTPQNSGEASAVAAWFGLGLQYQLDVPVGIIVSAWGGTPVESWTSYEAFCALPETREIAKLLRNNHRTNMEQWKDGESETFSFLSACVRQDPGNSGVDKGYAKIDFDDSSWQMMEVGGSWKQQHIAGNGAIWLRKTVEIPESWANCPLALKGGTVDKHDISYFNGVEIGRTGSGLSTDAFNKKRYYPIPPEAVVPGKAVVAIRAFSFAFDGAVSGTWNLVNEKDGSTICLNGTWQATAEYDWGDCHPMRGPATFGPGNSNTPSILFNNMISPLIPYAMRGVIWYQGENNAGTVESAVQYRDILQAMIDDWRYRWGEPDMPFIMVQLAGFGAKESFFERSPWAYLRESQRLIAAGDPDSYIATAIDLGEEQDIHPQDKFSVGKRLAMTALYNVYNYTDCVPSGPEIEKAECFGKTIQLFFKYASDLKLVSDEPSFFIAGKDGNFFPAEDVKIDGETLLVTSSIVDDPVQVRYAWANFPVNVLYNGAGMAASSFHVELKK